MKTLKNNKGFTLIEIVIVIVIIAILAAMLVPSMLSWIDSANQRTFLSAADTIKTSVSTQITDKYAKNQKVASNTDFTDTATTGDWAKVTALVGSTVSDDAVGTDEKAYQVTFTCTNNKLSTMTIKNTKYQVTYSETTGWSEVTAVS